MADPEEPSSSLHVAEEDAAALAEGRLPPADAERVRLHLAGCRTCMAAYADLVRYRAAWLAQPDLFESDDDLTAKGIAIAPGLAKARVRPRQPEWRRQAGWATAALVAAAVVFLATKPLDSPPMVSNLPPALVTALESQASTGLVLPGGEAGAARDPVRHRGATETDTAPLRGAIDSCVRLYESGPASAHLAYVAAAGFLTLDELSTAQDYCREAVEDHPDDPALLALAAAISLRSDRPAEAESLLRRGLSERPRDPLLRMNLALVLREQGEHREASRLLRELSRGETPLALRARRAAAEPPAHTR